MKVSRRDFLISSLGLTLSGCMTSLPLSEKEKALRAPSSTPNHLGYMLSSPHEEIKAHYRAVVVGSGYGASVMAARLGQRFGDMCIFERGKEWHPGDFPETLSQLEGSIKSSLNPLGLVDLSPGSDVDIVCASGLGGTSLLNAAIAIRPEPNVFQLKEWPRAVREAAANGELERYYQKAEAMLQPTSQNQLRFSKTQWHRQAALAQGRPWGELNLNIRPDSYASGALNSFGYPQGGCINCGNCCTGCNAGAKNTLVTNYLFSAYRQGVKIFTRVEVESIEKESGVYRLNLKLIQGFALIRRIQVTADYVFVGAGAKGSTELLLRSQSDNLKFSEKLGTRLSANGDVMALSYNGNQRSNILAKGAEKPGVIIASYANYRNPAYTKYRDPSLSEVQSQFLLLDGVVPSSLGGVVANAIADYATSRNLFSQAMLPAHIDRAAALKRIAADRDSMGAAEDGALNHSMLYFACGHDSSGGTFVYDKKTQKVDFVWPHVTQEPTFRMVNTIIEKEYAAYNGGVFIANPRSTVFGHKIQATHPLGGCPMGEDASGGVVSDLGQVFAQDGGYHNNLYVVDASIIPHSLSATPLLTITALAERIADNI